MRLSPSRPRVALLVLGALAVLTGYLLDGELFSGYAKGDGTYLVHAGIFGLALAGTTALFARTPLRRDVQGLAAATFALVVLFPIALGFIWYDLVLTPQAWPPTYPEPSIGQLAYDRFGYVATFSPLVAGYAVGAHTVVADADWKWVVPGIAAVMALVGPLTGYFVEVNSGAHPGFASLVFIGLGFYGLLAAVPLYYLARWEYSAGDGNDRGTVSRPIRAR